MKLKILSLNMHKGFGPILKGFTLLDMREAIRNIGAEIVFLQEVQGEHQQKKSTIANWPDASQFEYLADSVWQHYAYGKNAAYTEGHHGNAILSKFPILRWQNFDLSTNRFESRGALHVVIEVPHHFDELHLMCLHLNLLEKGRQIQIKNLIQYVHNHIPASAPLIIGGDFNDWRARISSPLQQELNLVDCYFSLHSEHAKTFPSQIPITPLDRIYVRGFTPMTAQVLTNAPWDRLSDHLPILSEIKN